MGDISNGDYFGGDIKQSVKVPYNYSVNVPL